METIDDKIKKSKDYLGLKIPCSLEVLTPIHIGSGVKLAKDIDFISDRNSASIVSQAELMQYLEDNPDELNTFINGGYKLSSLKRCPNGIKYSLQKTRIFEIFQFERNGNGQPYIPGSSLKGAIRTVILKNLFDALPPQRKLDLLNEVNQVRSQKEWAADSLIKVLIGKNPNHNMMRMIQVFDINFSTLELSKVLLLSLTNADCSTFGWKKLAQGMPNVSLKEDPTPLIVESLPIGAKSDFSLHIDDFLVKNDVAKNTLKFVVFNLAGLSSLINTYSRNALLKEKEFFSKLNTARTLNNVLKEIENVFANIPKEGSAEEKTEFVIRMSWGSGWKGMTGDFLETKWIDIFRKKYRQGKFLNEGTIFPIFPKTRKIVFEDDIPKYLPGWIKVKLNDKIVNQEIEERFSKPKFAEDDIAGRLAQFIKKPQNKKR